MRTHLQRATEAYNAAVQRMNDAITAIDTAGADADLDALQAQSTEAITEVERTRAVLDQAEAVERARNQHTPREVPSAATPAAAPAVRVTSEEATYRPDTSVSFFRDLVFAGQDSAAAARLERHRQETAGIEQRDITTADPGAAGVIPPVYLANLFANLQRPGRPFADALPTLPLPDSGMTLTIPKVQSGATVAVQASENANVSETDLDTQTVSVPVRTIAGLNDTSVQALERSFPGLDTIIFDDLRRAYDAQLDTQLLAGTGSSGQHRGIRAVSGINAVTYTDASPTAAELIPKLYDAIQRIVSNRYTRATHIVMHPRRAAWLASNLSSTFPLFQQGAFMQAAGSQDKGAVMTIAGLPVIEDPNIATNYGAGTNEDEIYVVSSGDLYLMEGNLRAEVFRDVLSQGLTVRLRLFAYSAFASERYAAAIAAISGTGLVTPAF